MSNPNGLQAEAKKVLPPIQLEKVSASLESAAQQAGETVVKEFGRARTAVTRVATQVGQTAKANPVATAGVLFGAGALLGALLHSALRPAPTAGQLMFRALKRGAASTGDSLMSGLKTARRAIA